MTEQRTVLVPEGLAGERVDTAIARMFGVSRTRAAELIAEGYVRVDPAGVGKSDRVHSGAMLEVEFPQRADPLEIQAEIAEGLKRTQERRDGNECVRTVRSPSAPTNKNTTTHQTP